ncbi:MAG: hypothetical protein WAX77_08995 [Methylococcaceae bacterium]
MQLQFDVNTDEINQSSQHKLFVEGKNDATEFDAIIIKELLANNHLNIDVRTMGGCDNVRSAAEALIREHPSYYFLIDRDDREQITVDKSWANFPNINTYNMLIWHKTELENYFIDPDYLEKSAYLKTNPRFEIRKRILNVCQQRLFLDAANLTLYRLNRELQKPLNTPHFKIKEHFANKDAGIEQLTQCFETINVRKIEISDVLQENKIKEIYSDFVDELSGGLPKLQYGSGTWLYRMSSGKEIFHTIANDCFQVKNANNILLTGEEQHIEIAKQLVRLPLEQQPLDFQELVRLLKNRIS